MEKRQRSMRREKLEMKARKVFVPRNGVTFVEKECDAVEAKRWEWNLLWVGKMVVLDEDLIFLFHFFIFRNYSLFSGVFFTCGSAKDGFRGRQDNGFLRSFAFSSLRRCHRTRLNINDQPFLFVTWWNEKNPLYPHRYISVLPILFVAIFKSCL